jgi:hypothetical protein
MDSWGSSEQMQEIIDNEDSWLERSTLKGKRAGRARDRPKLRECKTKTGKTKPLTTMKMKHNLDTTTQKEEREHKRENDQRKET